MVYALIGIALVAAVVGARHAWVAPAAAIALWVAVPLAWTTTVSLPLGIHPAGIAVIVGLLLHAAFRTRAFFGDVLAMLPTLLPIGGFLVLALLLTRAQQPGNLGMLLNILIIPVLAFVLIRHTLGDPEDSRKLRNAVVVVAVAEALIVIAVQFGVLVQPWVDELQAAAGARYLGDAGRAYGTMDHPLQLVAVFTIATPLLLGLRSAALRLGAGGLFVLATVLTQSRSGLILVVAAFVLVFFRGTSSPWIRILSVLTAVGVLGLVAGSDLASAVIDKFVSDGGSANARFVGLDWMFVNLDRFVVTGFGAGASFVLTTSLWTSLENPFAMYAVDYGFLPTIVLFAVMIGSFVARIRAPRPVDGGQLAGALTFLHMLTFASVAALGSSGAFLWIALAFAAVPLRARATTPTEEPSPALEVTVDDGAAPRLQAGVSA